MTVTLRNRRKTASLPADVCGFCERMYRYCQCDEPMSGYRLSDYGRAILFAAKEEPDASGTEKAAGSMTK